MRVSKPLYSSGGATPHLEAPFALCNQQEAEDSAEVSVAAFGNQQGDPASPPSPPIPNEVRT